MTIEINQEQPDSDKVETTESSETTETTETTEKTEVSEQPADSDED